MRRILVADDDAGIRSTLVEVLADEGFDVVQAESGDMVLSRFTDSSAERPELVIMDVRMPGKSGLDVLRELRTTMDANRLPVVVVTGFGSSNVAIEAIQLGAYDYITKPFDIDDLLVTVKRFFEWQDLNDQVQELATRLGGVEQDSFIGNSPAIQEVYKTIGRVARSDATVLITGETGTGKELVASILHRASNFARGPMVKVNCAALPEALLESELFGHEKGAFTGAIAQRKGRFELANKGTIFLDEVGEMTLSTQKKLLRVLQEREFERVGGTVTVKVDTRVVSATNKHLPAEIEEGRFREDLYYRLNVISIHLPPLRSRGDDIILLVQHFLHKHRYTPGAEPARISQAAMNLLAGHPWPGNVRELENVIERAVILAQGGVVTEQHIDFTGGILRSYANSPRHMLDGRSLPELLSAIEREAITDALTRANGEELAAASILGITAKDLQKRIGALNIPVKAE
jgi:two-component system, NtrC family, response regulator AtoC